MSQCNLESTQKLQVKQRRLQWINVHKACESFQSQQQGTPPEICRCNFQCLRRIAKLQSDNANAASFYRSKRLDSCANSIPIKETRPNTLPCSRSNRVSGVIAGRACRSISSHSWIIPASFLVAKDWETVDLHIYGSSETWRASKRKEKRLL